MQRWNDKVAVVTGASKGIGKVLAQMLVDRGMKVVGIARNVDSINQIDGKFYAVRADLRKEEDVVKAFEWIAEAVGPVSVLVNNAAMRGLGLVLDGNSAIWKDAFDANVIGLSIATREAVKQMRKHNIDGHIVHMNSIYGHKVSIRPPLNVYAASKHAVTALTETLRQELNSIGSKIKITSISPCTTGTEGIKRLNPPYPVLECSDVGDAVCYALGTPPHIQIHELVLGAVGSPM